MGTRKETTEDRLTRIERRIDEIGRQLAQGNAQPGLTVTATIRQEVAASGLTTYALSKRAGLNAAALDRWIKDDSRDLSGESINKLATALGLKLVKPAQS